MADKVCSSGWVLEKEVKGDNVEYKPFFMNVRGEDIIGPYGDVAVPDVNYTNMDFIKSEAVRISGNNKMTPYLDNYKYTFLTPDKTSKATIDSNLNFDLITKYDVYANKNRISIIPNTLANSANIHIIRVPIILPFKIKNTELFINELSVNTDAVYNILTVSAEYNRASEVQFLNEISVYFRILYNAPNPTIDTLIKGMIQGTFMELTLNLSGKLYK